MNDSDEPERRNRTWVLVAKVDIDKGKEGLRFLEVAPESRSTDGGLQRIFAAKSFKLAYVGNVYTIDATETQCWPDTLRFVGKWHDAEQVAGWQAKAGAFDVQRRMAKLAKEAGRANELREALEPIRRVYRETDTTGRIALEATVVYLLRHGSTASLAGAH